MPTDRQQRCKNPDCRQRFTRPQGTSRLYCYDCHPERKSNVVELPTADASDEATMVSLTVQQLRSGGVLETWQAMACIKLAELIDSGKHGASGPAGTIKAHREAMAIALADAGKKADVIDMIFADEA